jgi:hypothetical protein
VRRAFVLLSALAVLAGVIPAAASAPAGITVYRDPGVGGFKSPNVTYLGTIPIEAIGGRMLKVGNQMRFYVTGAPGLVIYDVTNPAVPVPLGGLPLPHFQNEDVDVSDDGKRVIISTDTASADSSGRTGNGIRIIDTSNVLQPKIVGFIANSNHTTTCADSKCEWLYGSNGRIYDATNPANVRDTGNRWGGGGHALNRDASGLMISDSSPRLVLDVSNPANPVRVTTGNVAPKFAPDGLLQHNNVRLGADQWVPRDPQSPDYNDPTLRAGELLVGNAESNLRNSCGGNAGGLSTWSMANWDKGEPMRQLEVFRPVNGNWADGNPAVNALGCSGHWFTVRDNMIAASWYEHGVRFIAVDPATGKLTQKGYFQPVVTEAGSAHWVTGPDGTEYVYTTDYARGIDILKFDRKAEVPTPEQFDASWLAKLGTVGPLAAAERYACRLAMRATQ